MEIKPTYVTFEQAKLLKKKGFNMSYRKYYNEDSTEILHTSKYSILNKSYRIKAPEQWQVVEWLRINHGIHITYGCDYNWKLKEYRDKAKFYYIIDFDLLDSMDEKLNPKFLFNSPQEAYSAAFDYVLTKLI